MTELEKEPAAPRLFKTDVHWPLMDVSVHSYGGPTALPLIHERGVVSGTYIVPGRDGGLYRVTGGFNWWFDNNCCGSMGFSALQVAYYAVQPGWSDKGRNIVSVPNMAGQNDKDDDGNMVASYERMLAPELSPFLHVREFAPDFPALSFSDMTTWFSGVLICALIGKAKFAGRNLVRGVDAVGGSLSTVLKLTHACRNSHAISPYNMAVENYLNFLDRKPFATATTDKARGIDWINYAERGLFLDNLYVYTGPCVRNSNSGNSIRDVGLSCNSLSQTDARNLIPQIRKVFPEYPNSSAYAQAAALHTTIAPGRLRAINHAHNTRRWVTYMVRSTPWLYS